MPRDWFSDVAVASGIDFVHFNGMSGQLYYPEVVGSGAAFVDYDNDGDLDVYLVQGRMLGPGKQRQDALFPPEMSPPDRDRLYRNDLVVRSDGTRELKFTDVTGESGIEALGYGMGVATGDIDNDGWVDLYVTNFGPNQMFHNQGDGTFRAVTRETGTEDDRWTVAATFVDFDRDGWLDLMVVNYLDFSYQVHKVCLSERGDENYCHPSQYRPVPDRLFRNRGDGTFEDVTQSAGIEAEYGSGLGVIAADLNEDDWPDLYVANDAMPNQLWLNQGDGTFVNEGLMGGCALNHQGEAEASMGVDAADFDADGDEDLFLTHLFRETNTLYVNQGAAFFSDVTVGSGLAGPSWSYTGFGTGWMDYDNDGWLDLFVLNGAVTFRPEADREVEPYPLDEPNQLFHNRGDGRFEEVSVLAGEAFRLREVSRGAAMGDVDNDGDTDLLVLNNSGPARLLLNTGGQDRPWIGLRLMGESESKGALGTRLAIYRTTGPTLWRRQRTDGGYAAARDPRVLVGLGDENEVSKVRAFWPDGGIEEWSRLRRNTYYTLEAGTGKRVR